MSGAAAVTIFVVALIASIMLHEWGHFWTARRFGMRADRYFLGFGPTLWSTQRGETEYGVKAIPAGGFVRIRGMSPEDRRRQPVLDTLFDREALAADRRAQAEHDDDDLTEVAAVPEVAWQRLSTVLDARGTPRDVRDRIVDRARRNTAADATADEARDVLCEVLVTEVTDTGRLGDLHHRLMRGDEGRFFADRPAWQRAIVLSAGSAMHFTIAVAVLLVGFLVFPRFTGDALPVIDQVQDGSPAAAAGLQPGDEIVSYDGRDVDEFSALRDAIQRMPGQTTELTVVRDGETLTLTVTPAPEIDEDSGETVGRLGFVPAPETKSVGIGDAVYETFVGEASVPRLMGHSLTAFVSVFGPEGLGAMFDQLAGQAERDANGGVSIVGAADVAGDGVQVYGGFFLISIIASINVFIGVFNLLPLPPLDGGHLAVLGVERTVNGVRRRRGKAATFSVDPRAVAAIAVPVIVMFGVVSLALVWLDITNPISLQ